MRWCAGFLVAGGIFGLVRPLIFLILFLLGREDFLYGSTEWFFALGSAMYVGSLVLISLGACGILPLLPDRPRLVWNAAALGVSVCLLGSAGMIFGITYEFLSASGSYSQNPLLKFLFVFGTLIGPFGLVVVGVASLWARGLGFARYLVLLAAVLTIRLLTEFLFTVFVYPFFGFDSALVEVLYTMPQTLFGLLWIVVGIFLFGGMKRDDRFAIREREELERRNLDIARRLYGEAWVEGEYGVLDGLVAPDVVDEYHGEAGFASFRRNVRDLRRTFPDLRFDVTEQVASHDAVTTRWTLTGTDEGGILWYPPTGRRVSISGCFTDTFRDGVLVEHRGQSDTREVVERLERG